MELELQYKRYSENSILIEWPPKIEQDILQNLLFCKKSIEKYYGKVIVEIISSYSSLLICYHNIIEDFYSEVLVLKKLCGSLGVTEIVKKRLWEIPVCYSTTLAADLSDFSNQKSLSIDKVISLHTAPLYTVFFLGFLPGFFYLGGLDEKLSLPRKKTPVLQVEKGSVAIGENQTGVYPIHSPGGWHVIGRSPIEFFNPNSSEPCFVIAGDHVKFISIEEYEYNDIKERVENNIYQLKPTFL
ncbi:5-oxoprolinase subunit PxpB [Aquimarina sp. AU474]|uniref:5-oxoprolinase subunit PxpB n=1 Tax=Aquimarina sp. AU474 TaxID=2108529 RepID=UPI000D68F698|nr:5-oxoprolinase subunit PxpB [Aquimarina sp. AU474]